MLSFLAVANESMCRPIRALTEAVGYDAATHNLASFGGAGGQHAASIATILGIKRVLIHKYSSILSAYGMAAASIVHEEQVASALTFNDETKPDLVKELDRLEETATLALLEQGIAPHHIHSERYLNMRYRGSDATLMIRERGPKDEDFDTLFIADHHRQFGFTPQNASIIVDDVRVRCIGESELRKENSIVNELNNLHQTKPALPASQKHVYFE